MRIRLLGLGFTLCNILWLGLQSLQAQAMWARMTDDELIDRSALIVQGRYIGESSLTLAGQTYRLGAIEVEVGFKGAMQQVVFISRPDPQRRKSDDIALQVGQRGLWLLEDSAHPGLYVLRHPQRFVPAAEAAVLLDKLHKLDNPSAP